MSRSGDALMEDIWAKNGGVYFGYGCDRTQGEPPSLLPNRLKRYVGDRHLVTVGPNGSGKTRRLLLPNLADLIDWSILVVDPKGDLAVMTAEHRRQGERKVVLLNPFDVFGLGSDGFNPVAALESDSPDFPDDAMGLAEAMIRVEGKEPHFSQTAQDLVCALIMYVRLTLPNPSLVDVRAFLGKSSEDFRKLVLGKFVKHEGRTIPGMIHAGILYDCPELEVKASRFSDISAENRELLSVMSTAMTQTRWVDSRPIKGDLQKGAYDFSRMKEEPTTVFLILPARRLGTHSTWLRLMITSVLQPLLKDTRAPRVPTLLMLDEFAQLGHLPAIENTLAMMRGYGVKLWAVFQDFAQAKAIYEERWQSFIGNSGVVQAFAPRDVVTAKELSDAVGQTTRLASNAAGEGKDANIGLNQISVPLMLPQELRNMDDGFSIYLSHQAKGPLRLFIPYPDTLPHMQDICARDPARRGNSGPYISAPPPNDRVG